MVSKNVLSSPHFHVRIRIFYHEGQEGGRGMGGKAQQEGLQFEFPLIDHVLQREGAFQLQVIVDWGKERHCFLVELNQVLARPFAGKDEEGLPIG